MRLLFLYVFMLISLTGCFEKNAALYRPSDKEQSADAILAKTAARLRNEKGLVPVGTGGQMMYQIEMLALAFQYREPMEIDSGRRLLLTAVEEFAAEVNGDGRIRQYLGNYPFKANNIEIRIFLENQDRSDIEPGKLCLIAAKKGVLEYDIRDPKTDRLTTIYTETYEEALQKVYLGK